MHEAASQALFDEEVLGLTPRVLTARNWFVYNSTFPALDVGFRSGTHVQLRIRLLANDWNDQPPSIELLNAAGEYLTEATAPRHPMFNLSAHPNTGRPFVCSAGSREYHTHPSHLSDSWDNYRGRDSYKLGGILDQLWHGWLEVTS
jgi:hypothetical protein